MIGVIGHAVPAPTTTSSPPPDLRTLKLNGPAADTNGELSRVDPATAARFGRRLAVVNAKLDTGFPPTADHDELVLAKA